MILIQKYLNLGGWMRGDTKPQWLSIVLNILENAKKDRKYIGTIHMVQNTKALLYYSIVTFPY